MTHKALLTVKEMILDTALDSYCEASQIFVSGDFIQPKMGKLYLQRTKSTVDFTYYTYGGRRISSVGKANYINSDPSELRINGMLISENGSAILNQSSLFHAHKKSPLSTAPTSTDIAASLYQKFICKEDFETAALRSASYGSNYNIMTMLRDIRAGYITSPQNSIADNGCLIYVFGFQKLTNNFEGAQKTFPAQTSFGTNTFIPAQDSVMTRLEGRMSAPILIVSVAEEGAEIGSVTMTQTPTRSPLQSLSLEQIDLRLIRMSKNLKNLMECQPFVDSFSKFVPRHFFEPTAAQQFYQQVRPFVRVQKPDGGFEAPRGQVLFELAPPLLLKAVQDKALEVLGRGNIEPNRPLDEAQLLTLHQNFVEYLEETGRESTAATDGFTGPLSLVNLEGNPERAAPKKPFIAYKSMMNEQGILELSPVIWIPREMHHDGGIQTQLLLVIPAGLTLADWLQLARTNFMLADTLKLLTGKAPGMLKSIESSAQKYRTQVSLGKQEEYAIDSPVSMADFPMGDVTLNGKISAGQLFALNTGNVISHADIKCQDALLLSLFKDVRISSKATRTGGGQNFEDRILHPARIHARGILQIFADNDVVFEAAQTHSELGTHILALANIFDIPVHLMRQRVQQMTGKYDGIETFIDIIAQTSTHTSGGAFTQQSKGSQNLHAPTYDAASVDVEAQGDLTFAAAHNQHIHTYQGKKEGTFSSKTIQGGESRTTSRGANITSRERESRFISHKGDASFTAPAFRGAHGATLRVPNGKVMIKLGRNSTEISYSTNSDGMMWKKMVQGGESHFTFTVPSTDGPVDIFAKETVLESIQGKHLAFLDDLDVKEGSFINQVVAELHDEYSDVVEGPGMALAVIVAIVVTCCTGGAGLAGALAGAMSASVGTTAAGIVAAGFTAAINTGITNNILDTIAADGNIFKAAVKSHSKERLKEAGVSGVKGSAAAGIASQADSVFGKSDTLDFSTKFAKNLTQNLATNTASAGIDSLAYGAEFQESFLDGMKKAAVDTALDTGQESLEGLAGIKSPETFKETLGLNPAEFLGHTTAKMVRNFASQNILGEESRDALVKAIAQAAAELAFREVNEQDNTRHSVGEAARSSPQEDPQTEEKLPRNHPQNLETFFGDEQGVPPVKPLFDVDDTYRRSDSMPLFEDVIQDIPWLDTDEMLRTSAFGLAYHNHYPINPVQEFYYPDSLSRDTFEFLANGAERAQGFAERHPGITSYVSRGIESIGDAFHYTSQMGVSLLAGDLGLAALNTFEDKMGQLFEQGAQKFSNYAYNQGRNPVEQQRFYGGSTFALEGLGSAMVLMNVRGVKKGGLVSVLTSKKQISRPFNLGEGYHVRMVDSTPIIVRNPGRVADLPQLRYVDNEIVKLFDLRQNAPGRVHGCSNSYVGDTHVYVIRDELGQVYKVGESMQGYTKLGLSKRAEQQAEKLRIQTGRWFDTEVLHRFPTKKLAKSRETRTIKVLRKRYKDDAVPGNKNNH